MRRRSARAAALRALFAMDVGKNDTDAALRVAMAEDRLEPEGMAFARELLQGVLEHRDEIDARIGQLSRDWSVERLAAVDRNLLRLGLYELAYRHEHTPVAVAINEAVELAKEYSTPESGRFVNGILGGFARQQGLVDGASPVADPEAAEVPKGLHPEGGSQP